jgi:hypothetical protein
MIVNILVQPIFHTYSIFRYGSAAPSLNALTNEFGMPSTVVLMWALLWIQFSPAWPWIPSSNNAQWLSQYSPCVFREEFHIGLASPYESSLVLHDHYIEYFGLFWPIPQFRSWQILSSRSLETPMDLTCRQSKENSSLKVFVASPLLFRNLIFPACTSTFVIHMRP